MLELTTAAMAVTATADDGCDCGVLPMLADDLKGFPP